MIKSDGILNITNHNQIIEADELGLNKNDLISGKFTFDVYSICEDEVKCEITDNVTGNSYQTDFPIDEFSREYFNNFKKQFIKDKILQEELFIWNEKELQRLLDKEFRSY